MIGNRINEFDLIDQIVDNVDMIKLFKLENNSAFSIALHRILVSQYAIEPSSLNKQQLNLFLCMHLENAGQADGILSFLQEWFPDRTIQVIKSLNEIGAKKSAIIIEQAVKLLPDDGSWFFNNADEETRKEMQQLDSAFSDYPDGFMRNLFREYSEKNKEQIINL